MGKGKKIECPLGGDAKKKRRTQPEPQGSAIIAGKVEANEARYVNNRIKEIEQALVEAGQGNPMQVDRAVGEAIPHEDQNNGHAHLEDNYINNFLPAPQEHKGDGHAHHEDNYINNFLPAPHQQEVVPNGNINNANYVPRADYKSKRIMENKNWKKAIPQMFISYMKLAQTTSQWGNNLNWNHDHNKQCSCGAGNLRTRKVDIVDILGEISDYINIYYDH